MYTDNNPLAYVLTTARLNALGHRFLGELSKYRLGKLNADADTLSWFPVYLKDHMSDYTETLLSHMVSAV